MLPVLERLRHGVSIKKLSVQATGSEADTPSADDGPDLPASIRRTMLQFKYAIANRFGWSLYEIDETDFESLFAFATYNPDKRQGDPDTRIIDGHISKRVQGAPPSWL